MTPTSPQSCEPQSRPAGPEARRNWLVRAASAIGRAFADMNYAQRRITHYRMSYDRYLPRPDDAPETYAEFLLRTTSTARQEPSARERANGRHVR